MPAPNDLSPEEEALFSQHGVAPAGQGGEPIVEEGAPVTQPAAQPEPVEEGAPVPQPTAQPSGEPAPGELGSRRRADGTFKSAEELAADNAAILAGGQNDGQPAAQPAPQPDARTVPIAALHEARARTAAIARQMQTLSARTNAILENQQRAQPQNQMPDLETNPAAFVLALDERLRQFEQTRAEEEQYRRLDNALEEDETLFSQYVPDYEQASDHYVASRARELAAFYQPQDIHRLLIAEARSIAQNAWQRGMSPAEVIYGLAQARGYQPGQQQAQPQVVNPQVVNPQVVNPQAQPKGPTPAAVVQAITAGQQASKSLSGGGGAAPTGQLNAEALLAMSDDEFEAHLGLGKKGADARFAAVGG